MIVIFFPKWKKVDVEVSECKAHINDPIKILFVPRETVEKDAEQLCCSAEKVLNNHAIMTNAIVVQVIFLAEKLKLPFLIGQIARSSDWIPWYPLSIIVAQ